MVLGMCSSFIRKLWYKTTNDQVIFLSNFLFSIFLPESIVFIISIGSANFLLVKVCSLCFYHRISFIVTLVFIIIRIIFLVVDTLQIFARTKYFSFVFWSFNLFFLICNRVYDGYSFSTLGWVLCLISLLISFESRLMILRPFFPATYYLCLFILD